MFSWGWSCSQEVWVRGITEKKGSFGGTDDYFVFTIFIYVSIYQNVRFKFVEVSVCQSYNKYFKMPV